MGLFWDDSHQGRECSQHLCTRECSSSCRVPAPPPDPGGDPKRGLSNGPPPRPPRREALEKAQRPRLGSPPRMDDQGSPWSPSWGGYCTGRFSRERPNPPALPSPSPLGAPPHSRLSVTCAPRGVVPWRTCPSRQSRDGPPRDSTSHSLSAALVSAVLVARLLEQRVVRDGRPAGTREQGGDQGTSPHLFPNAEIKGPVRVFDRRPEGTRGQGGDQRTSPHLPPHAEIKGPVRVSSHAVSRPRLAAVRRESR